MSNVLDQSEVDALLATVDEGLGFNLGEESDSFGLNDEEISIYDFKRPERVSKEQVRSLENLHEVFARNLSASWTGYLRNIVDIKLASVEQLTYSEFVMSLPNPTCFSVLSAEPLEGEIILELNPSVVFPFIDKLLGGGTAESLPPDRPLTEIELNIIRKIISQALQDLKVVWERATSIDFRLQEIESNPQLRQIVPPNEVVVLISFELIMGENSGMMNLCIPFMVIEPIMGIFVTQSLFTQSRKAADATSAKLINDNLTDAKVDLITYLAGTSMNLSDYKNLKVGDFLLTKHPAKNSLVVEVEGVPKFTGKPVVYKKHKAIQLDGFAANNEKI